VRIGRAAIIVLSALVAIPLGVRAAQLNIASLRLARALASTHPRCAVHESLCVPVGGTPTLTAVAADFGPFAPFSEFSRQGIAFARAASGDIRGAEREWQETPGELAKLNLGRLYWTTGREALAVDTWRAAAEPTWIAMLLRNNVEPQPASASTDRLVRFVLDDLGGDFDAENLAGLVGSRFGQHLDAVSHFQRALVFRPDDPLVLIRLAEAYGSRPYHRLTRAEHAAIADQMEAAVRFDPEYSDLHVLVAVSVCQGRDDYAAAQREVDTARRLGFALPLPGDLVEGLARKCQPVP
jgi:tetratricopeptide (TPR) repeat protein